MRYRTGKVAAAIGLLMGGTALVAPSPAWASASAQAQDEAAAAADAEDEAPADIVVTARRRAERLIDVPVSISAFTNDDIEDRGVTSLSALQTSVPGLRIVDIGPGSQRIQLRGISQYLGLPTVGNYVDEFSVNNEAASGSADVRLLDMERVEVLRGPQPALYGEGSMGGTIRYVTARPDLDELGGSVLGEINTVRGGDLGYRAEGVLNIPIATDVAGLRIAGATEKVGGWIDGPLGEDANDARINTIRAKLLIEPSSDLSISLLGMYHEARQDVKNYSKPDRTTDQVAESISNQDYFLGNLVVSYDAGPVTLLSSTGYLDQDGRSVDDSARFYNTLFGAPLLRTALTDTNGNFERFAQEFRLSSNGSGPLRYLVGVSYSKSTANGFIDAFGESLIPGVTPESLGVVFTQDSRVESRVWAVFGSVSYDLGDRFTIDVGGRYFSDKRSVDSTFTLIGFPVPPSVAQDSATFESFNPRVNLNFKTSANGIIYANVAKGFRSGGFNQVTDPTTPPTFGPEKLWTYEIGTRQAFADNKLLVEAAIYYNDYKGIQAAIIQGGGTVAATRNSGNAKGFGVDLSVQARPRPDLRLTATLGYNDVEYKTASIDRLPGDPPDLVPQWTGSASIDYTPRLSETLGLIVHADAGYTDEAQITLRNIPPGFNQVEYSDSRFLVNARLGVSFDKFELYAFANNLFDENRIVNPAFGAFFEPIRTRPRTIGLGLKAGF